MQVPQKKTYKYCLVPTCSSTTTLNPSKRFLSVPLAEPRRSAWLTAIKHFGKISSKTHHHVCEDHFDLENDAENYTKLRFFPESRVHLKPEVVPHIFECLLSSSEELSMENSSICSARRRRRKKQLSSKAKSTPKGTNMSTAPSPPKGQKTPIAVVNVEDSDSCTSLSEQPPHNSVSHCQEVTDTFCFVDCDVDSKSDKPLMNKATPLETVTTPKPLPTPVSHPTSQDIPEYSQSTTQGKTKSSQATNLLELPKKASLEKETQTVFSNCSVGVMATPLINSTFVQCDLGSQKARVDTGSSP